MFETNYFGIVDYIVVITTILFSIIIGMYYGTIKKQTTDDLLLGGRKMTPIPIAASIMVTYLSAIRILGFPAEVFYFGIEVFMISLVSAVFTPISAFIFVRVFYNMKLTSVYEYLELRYNSILTRWLGGFIFILQMVVITSVVLYAPSIALEAVLGIPMWMSIIGIGLSGTIYTSIGGFKAVVWSDVFQMVMILAGMFVILVKGFISGGGIYKTFEIAASYGRLNLFNLTIDPFMRHNMFNFIFGYGFTFILLGAQQTQVQRYCSLPSVGKAIRAMLISVPMNLCANIIILLTGISIFATYHDCDPYKSKKIKRTDGILSYYVIQELRVIPGMIGLFIAVIFSAVLSTISSALNSLTAVTWKDFFLKWTRFQQMETGAQVNISKCIGGFYGVLIISLAFTIEHLGPILPMTSTFAGGTGGPLSAIFIMGLFMPCINKYGAISGMVCGLSSTFFVIGKAFTYGVKKLHQPMPTSIIGCIPEFLFQNYTAVVGVNGSNSNIIEEWPTKFFTMSYLMYPIFGASITIFVGILVSYSTGNNMKKKISRKYLHPLMMKSKNKNILKFNNSRDEENLSINSMLLSSNIKSTQIGPIKIENNDKYKFEGYN